MALGLFDRGSRVAERVEMLLARGREFSGRASRARLAMSGVALLGLLVMSSVAPRWIAFAQEPAFDAASVKPNAKYVGSSGRVSKTPGRFLGTSATARLLIREAFGVKDYQLSGGPSWLDTDRFDVEGKSGIKFPEIKPGEPRTAFPPMRPGMVGRMYAANLSALADMLSQGNLLGRPVLEKTGLTGNYLIDIQSGPDEDLVTVVQDQGLRLEPAKGSIEMVVIDHLEKPGEN
jgi:Protein of unknown function (DUF3738)